MNNPIAEALLAEIQKTNSNDESNHLVYSTDPDPAD